MSEKESWYFSFEVHYVLKLYVGEGGGGGIYIKINIKNGCGPT